MTPVQREARIRHRAAVAVRRVLEESYCESILAGDDVLDQVRIRGDLGQARIRESVAEVQARLLGVAA